MDIGGNIQIFNNYCNYLLRKKEHLVDDAHVLKVLGIYWNMGSLPCSKSDHWCLEVNIVNSDFNGFPRTLSGNGFSHCLSARCQELMQEFSAGHALPLCSSTFLSKVIFSLNNLTD